MKKNPKLSELKGVSMCAPQAALGVKIFQEIAPDYLSAYVNTSIKTKEQAPSRHSTIVVQKSSSPDITFILEPLSPHNNDSVPGAIPKIAHTEVPFTKDNFNELPRRFYTATEIFTGEQVEYLFGSK